MQYDTKRNALDAARDQIGHRLQESIDRLRDDIACVEYWAEVLDGFSKSVPGYEQSAPSLNRYLLPQQHDDGGDHS